MIRLKDCCGQEILLNEEDVVSVQCGYFKPAEPTLKEGFYRLVKLRNDDVYWVVDTIDEIEKKIKSNSVVKL